MSAERAKQRLQAALRVKGEGVLGLKTSFEEFDTDGDGVLSFEEFTAGLQKLGLAPSTQDIRALFIEFDIDRNNAISYDEFIENLRGKPSVRRIEVISQVFELIDTDHDGIISVNDVAACLNAKNHPDVRAGRVSVSKFRSGFLENIETVSDTGLLNLDQFIEFYTNIGALEDDDAFVSSMYSLWMNNRPVKPCSASKTLEQLLQPQEQSARGLDTLRKQLLGRGPRGIIEFQRKLKAVAKERNGHVSLVQFKAAIKEMGVKISGAEQIELFSYFDVDKTGSIYIDKFLQGMRGNLNERRQRIVNLAFRYLDKEGKGSVTPEDIVGVFDASRHPDVLSGSKNVREILTEFLETFDVGGEIDGQVTRQEFLDYYANISASIEDDSYFEQIICNVWRLSGDASSHTAPSSQITEAAKLNFKPKDTAEPFRDLYQHEINSLSSQAASIIRPDANQDKTVHKGNSEKEISIARRGHRAPNPNNEPDKFLNTGNMTNPGINLILQQLRSDIKERDVTGFIALQRKFREIDEKNSNHLTMVEFKRALKEMRVGLDDGQMRMLFNFFDKDHTVKVNIDEFLCSLRGPMTERRKRLVLTAFNKLDKEGNGVVDAEEIATAYDASRHPEVLAEKKSAEQMLRKFLETFDVGGDIDEKVTLSEFENYYANVSAAIENDNYFELMIRNVWHIAGRIEDIATKKSSNTVQSYKQGVFASSISFTGGVDEDLANKEVHKPQSLSAVAATAHEHKADSKNVTAPVAVPPPMSREQAIAQAGARVSAPTAHSPRPTVAGIITSNTVIKDASFFKSSGISPGLQLILQRVQKELKSRGVHGFIGLQRKFRIMDTDGSKSLDMGEFKKAIKEMNLGLEDAEIRMLFDYFDKDHNGSIDFEEFVRGVRGQLTERRRSLVKLAFARLDCDGNGVVDAGDIAKLFDPSKHPDVLSGQLSPMAVVQQFLDTFDVGGEIDGKVTEDEFINYYTNLGASIDNDDYFELMIRNVWHIPGGMGWAANSANMRGLVAGARGTESVVELANDLGIRSNDNDGLLARLGTQKVFASHLSTAGLLVHDNEEPRQAKRFSSEFRQSSAAAGLLPGTAQKKKATSSNNSNMAVRKTAVPVPAVGVQNILNKIKSELACRGSKGFITFQRKFRIADADDIELCAMELGEFKKRMKELNLGLSDSELRLVFEHFDVDQNGTIDCEDLIQGVRDPLTERRQRLVRGVFKQLDKDNDGLIDVQEMALAYQTSKHPEVIAGRLTPDHVFRELLDTFDVGSKVEGKVTLDEFLNYYTNLGASIESDDYFELLISNSWNTRDNNSTPTASRTDVIKDDVSLKRTQSQVKGVGTSTSTSSVYAEMDSITKGKAFSNTNSLRPNMTRSVSAPRPRSANSSYENPVPTGAALGCTKKKAGTPMSGPQSAAPFQVPTYGLQLVIQKLKAALREHGNGFGYISLQRKFRIMDADGSKSLDLSEFRKGMKELNMGLSDPEVRMLFDYFDTNHNGTIEFEEFIQGIREPLNERRLAVVKQAFNKLDKDKSGFIDCNDIIDIFDASNHPDVISKRKTAQQVLSEFLNTFDVGGEVDGKVTFQEFVNYYTNLGASIDNDEYFELMIRNAWNLDGGSGASVNRYNRRVLVTQQQDGNRQNAQGVSTSNNSFHDGSEQIKPTNQFTVGKPRAQSAPRGRPSTAPVGAPPESPRFGRFSAGVSTYSSQIVLGDDHSGPDKENISSTSANNIRRAPINDLGASLKQRERSNTQKAVEALLNEVRSSLASRGVRGMVSMQRRFKLMDTDGNGTLSYSEFKKGIKECGVFITEEECKTLFSAFDANKDGCIDHREFMNGIRGPMNERRRRVVLQAFSKLDKNGDGIIEPQEIIDTYDASKHPDVISGRKKPASVLREFLDTFDVGGVVDGMVTQQEFVTYYSNLSALIDNDEYFELMVRRAWNIVEAEGRDNASHSVESAGFSTRIKAPGVVVEGSSSVSLFDGGSDENEAKTQALAPRRFSSSFGSNSSSSKRSNPITGINVNTQRDTRRNSLGGQQTFKIRIEGLR